MQLIFKVNYTHENERNDTYVGVFRVVVVTPCDHQRPPKWIIWKDEAPATTLINQRRPRGKP